MVHGGLRYIAKGQFGLTRDSVRERQRLLQEAPGLVDPLSFIMAHYQGGFPGPKVFGGLLAVYDALAGKRNHLYYPLQQLRYLAPGIKEDRPARRHALFDAVTDDARLVSACWARRVPRALKRSTACAWSSCCVKMGASPACSPKTVRLACAIGFKTRAVAQATGAWADQLRQKTGLEHIRPLRGSHLLLPAWRLPVAHAFSFMHAADKRPVFVFPWEGATVIGTTDLDHPAPLAEEARISPDEVDYLLAACAQQFPAAEIGAADVLSTWAGVRPVVSDGAPGRKPSDEKREHALLGGARLRDPGGRQADHLPPAGVGSLAGLRAICWPCCG
jgi:glycerol-3-phosphate dehydrogenase